jgi:hypothetical protein
LCLYGNVVRPDESFPVSTALSHRWAIVGVRLDERLSMRPVALCALCLDDTQLVLSLSELLKRLAQSSKTIARILSVQP